MYGTTKSCRSSQIRDMTYGGRGGGGGVQRACLKVLLIDDVDGKKISQHKLKQINVRINFAKKRFLNIMEDARWTGRQ